MESHTYRGPADLVAIKDVLRAGRIEAPTAGHWHPGEIDWWFFYGPERLPHTTIWTDVDGPAGWVLVDGESRSADTGIRPDLRGGPAEAEMAPTSSDSWAKVRSRSSPRAWTSPGVRS